MKTIYDRPAFPQQNVNKDFYPGSIYEGATMLDYFAIRILQGAMASHEGTFTLELQEKLCDFSYGFAQSMLKAWQEDHDVKFHQRHELHEA